MKTADFFTTIQIHILLDIQMHEKNGCVLLYPRGKGRLPPISSPISEIGRINF